MMNFIKKARLQIGRLEINNNLDSARRDLEENDFDGAMIQVEEAENDLNQLAQDLNVDVPQNQVFENLKRQIENQNREGALSSIEEIQAAIDQATESANNPNNFR
jgi:hypothetical protein